RDLGPVGDEARELTGEVRARFGERPIGKAGEHDQEAELARRARSVGDRRAGSSRERERRQRPGEESVGVTMASAAAAVATAAPSWRGAAAATDGLPL